MPRRKSICNSAHVGGALLCGMHVISDYLNAGLMFVWLSHHERKTVARVCRALPASSMCKPGQDGIGRGRLQIA